ncbi:XkdQ/YqbQ family protein [Clostridium oceanicum]|uniref:YqbQ/XkdQ domain-containing protein n=1 Tax=Clostridium oceanicum TaxID=1543 RepID=A0ABN1JCL1_9CLOT
MWNLYTSYIVGKGYISKNIIGYSNNFSWSNDTDTLCTQISFDSILDLAEGRSKIVLKKDNIVVFEGVIVNKTNKENTHSYTAMDYAWYLNKNKYVMQFRNVNAKTAIQQICNKVGIKTKIINLRTIINKIYHQESLSDIIKDILKQCKNEIGEDYIMEMQGKTLYINKLIYLKVNSKLLIGKDYSVSRSIEDMQNYITAVNNDGKILATIKDSNSIKIFGELRDLISVDDKNSSQSYNISKNTLREKNKTKKELTFNTIDTGKGIYINCNRLININLNKYGVSGWYRIKSTQHTLSSGTHKISVTVDFS